MHYAFQSFVFLLLTCAVGSAPAAEPGKAPTIRVLAGDWGRAQPDEIEAVVRSAAGVLGSLVDYGPPLVIVVEPAAEHPEVRYDKNTQGEYLVALSARDRRWAQFAYQFGHEWCHVLANFDLRVAANGEPLTRHQWFEEVLCETAALFTLRTLAARWQSAPPYPHWKDYAPWFADYADGMLAAEHRRHAQLRVLSSWYEENSDVLARDPYARRRNDFCAAALLPLFESDQSQWNALRYLNLDGAAAEPTFSRYLARWQARVPERHRQFVATIAAAFAHKKAGDDMALPSSSTADVALQ